MLQDHVNLGFICLNCYFLLCFEHCLLSFESFLMLWDVGYWIFSSTMVVILPSYFWWKIWWCSNPVQRLLISVQLGFSLNFCIFEKALLSSLAQRASARIFLALSKLFSKAHQTAFSVSFCHLCIELEHIFSP